VKRSKIISNALKKQGFAFIENLNLGFPASQDQIFVEQLEDVPIDECPEYMSFLFDIHDEESDQTIAYVFEKDLDIEYLEQRSSVVEEKDGIFPYVYEQKKVSDQAAPPLC
jgi:hypothetical protein